MRRGAAVEPGAPEKILLFYRKTFPALLVALAILSGLSLIA